VLCRVEGLGLPCSLEDHHQIRISFNQQNLGYSPVSLESQNQGEGGGGGGGQRQWQRQRNIERDRETETERERERDGDRDRDRVRERVHEKVNQGEQLLPFSRALQSEGPQVLQEHPKS